MGRALSFEGIRVDGTEDGERPEPGDYYLLQRVDTRSGEERWLLSTDPGRTNMSHETRLSGWLGTTNDIAMYARGHVRVSRDASGRTRFARIAAEDARVEEAA